MTTVHETGERRERAVAAVASIVITAAIGALFLRPLRFPGSATGAEQAVEVVFVQRAPPRLARPRRHAHPPRAVHPRPAAGDRLPPAASAATRVRELPRLPVATGAGRPDATRLDDTWSIPGDHLRFQSSEDRLARRAVPEIEAHVDRLHVRMKTPVTVERVLEEAGQALGLWPPGYTDDPCPGIARLADYYRAHPPARGELLDDALDLERRCRKAPST